MAQIFGELYQVLSEPIAWSKMIPRDWKNIPKRPT